MFTGIIESMGTILDVRTEGTNRHFTFKAEMTSEVKVDQSCRPRWGLSHSGLH